jgi:hypothetical protein
MYRWTRAPPILKLSKASGFVEGRNTMLLLFDDAARRLVVSDDRCSLLLGLVQACDVGVATRLSKRVREMGYIMIALVLAAALAVAVGITIDFKINAESKCLTFIRANKVNQPNRYRQLCSTMTDAIFLGMVVLVKRRKNWTTPTFRFTAYLSVDLVKILSRL